MVRLQMLMKHAKSHGLPTEATGAESDSDDDNDDENDEPGPGRLVGVKAAHDRLKSIQQLYGTSPGTSPNGLQTPNRYRTDFEYVCTL